MPFIYPVRPLLAFCSTLSSRGGKATWLRARSKNKGLHGMGWNPGGKCTRLTCLLTREGSRQKVSNRSESGCKRPRQGHKSNSSHIRRVKRAKRTEQQLRQEKLKFPWEASGDLENYLTPCQSTAAGPLENPPMCREKAKYRKLPHWKLQAASKLLPHCVRYLQHQA